MAIPERQQIVPEDFKKEDQEIASKIAAPFNTYVEQLTEILSNNLTFTDNIRGALRVIQLQGDASTTFRYELTDKPVGVWVISYDNISDSSEVLTTAVSAQWSYDGERNITIKRVGGLTPADDYRVTLLIISG